MGMCNTQLISQHLIITALLAALSLNISHSEFLGKTGLALSTVQHAKKKLLEKYVIEKDDNFN